MGTQTDYPIRSKRGEPVWELATLYAPQGSWTEEAYLSLTDSRRGIEFNAGTLEFLPMPARTHQEIIFFLCQLLKDCLLSKGGDAWIAGIRVRTQADKIREPDVVAMLDRNDPRAGERLFEGADLVMEVVSQGPSELHRDYIEKRQEYEAAGIPEYWIIDPFERRVTVLCLRDGKYAEHSVANEGEPALSSVLEGFSADTTTLFNRP
jgi:Uma2 family endonuclease